MDDAQKAAAVLDATEEWVKDHIAQRAQQQTTDPEK